MEDRSLAAHYRTHQGKVSDKWSLYLREYARILEPYRERPVRLLEIGIQNGGSLEIWSRFFPHCTHLVGNDINPDCAALSFDDPRIRIVVGDANLDTTERAVLRLSDAFDVVIDDGSHRSSDIVRSFARYWPHVGAGGVYIAEDLHCSYWGSFEGGLFDPFSSMAFFKLLADVINHEHWGVPKARVDLLKGIGAHYGVVLDEASLAAVGSVEFVNSICVVRRLPPDDAVLGTRVVAGSDARVLPAIIGLGGTTALQIDQRDNPWSTRERSTGEEEIMQRAEIERQSAEIGQLSAMLLREREAAIAGMDALIAQQAETLAARDLVVAARERDVADREQRLAEARYELAALRESTSWRVTAPLRAAVSGLVGLVGLVGLAQLPRRLAAVRHSQGGWGGLIRYGMRRFDPGGGAMPAAAAAETPGYAEWVAEVEARRYPAGAGAPASEAGAPLISIVMPVFDTKHAHLESAIASVLEQSAGRWELCIVDDCSTDAGVRTICERHAATEPRIRFSERERNGGIVAATNDALALASGEFVCFLDHDDRLHPQAIRRLAETLAAETDADLVYTDEDKIDEQGRRSQPFLKPDWSPHLAISQSYLGHLVCYRRSLVTTLGGLRAETNGAQDFDLWLRASGAARRIVHLPEILYHWRLHEGSTALRASSKPYAHDAGRRAVTNYVACRYPGRRVAVEDGEDLFCYRARFTPGESDTVSIVIPTRDRVDLLGACIASIRAKSTWQRYEIVIVDNGSVEKKTADYLQGLVSGDARVRVIRADMPFNWSRLNNIGAAASTGSVLLFLNNDTEVISPDWLQYLAGYALLPDVGVVGGLLLFDDGTIQHSGVVVGMGGWADHVFRLLPPRHHVGPFVSPVLTRNALAVTGACLAIERAKFESLGRFDEAFMICGSDVEMGLRAFKKGFFNVMCGEARLLHYESKSRSPEVPTNDFEQSDLKYRPYRTGAVDPFFNPNLSLDSTRPVLAKGAGRA